MKPADSLQSPPSGVRLLIDRHFRLLPVLMFLVVAGSIVLTAWLLLFDGLAALQLQVISGADYLHQNPVQVSWLAGFAVVSLLLQLLIVPSGSLLLIGAGFVFGVLPAVAIYTAMQCLAVWPVYRMAGYALDRNRGKLSARVDEWLKDSLPTSALQSEALLSSIVFRLTPVLPSAAASTVAAVIGIKMSVFLLATVLAGWIRPLFFSSIGGAIKGFSGFETTLSSVDAGELAPLLLVFVSALVLLFIKLWLRRRQH